MNILFILPSLRLAGAERQTVDLATSIASSGHKVHLFTFESSLDLESQLAGTGVVFHHHLRRGKFDISNIWQISKIIDSEKIDIVHCALQISLFFGFWASRISRRKPKLIDTIHTTINRNRKHELFDRWLYLPMMRRCHRIIAVCDNQRQHWSAKYPELSQKMLTVHNGIDMNYFHDDISPEEKTALRQKLGINSDELVIGMLAGFRKEKNHEEVFIALKKLLEAGINVKLLLVGDGERRMFLENRAQELAISERIVWAGFTRNAKQYISLFDVGVLFSSTETFSMAILEMLAMGKPVVAADIGGTNEMIFDGENGYLVPIRDIGLLSEKLAGLLQNNTQRQALAKCAPEIVSERFSHTVMCEKTQNIYQNLCRPIGGSQ